LSDNGKIHSCQKSDLVKLLLSKVITPELEPAADAIIIDGSAFVNSMYPCISKTFDDYARAIVLPTIEKFLVSTREWTLFFMCTCNPA